MLKEQKGITLVALIITIIVMLILAGVSISLVVGEQGVLSQAQNAGTEQKKGAIKEAISLGSADFFAGCYDTTKSTTVGGSSTYNTLANLLNCIDANYEGGAKTVKFVNASGADITLADGENNGYISVGTTADDKVEVTITQTAGKILTIKTK